jgi:deoxyribose-phosphate aldolase
MHHTIDHTLLKPEATQSQIEQLCLEAKRYDFASVCIQPMWVSDAAKYLKDCNVKVCTVIGFPLGSNCTATKQFEAQEAVRNGADELDMVINIGWLKAGRDAEVTADIAAVVQAAQGRTVKVIIETCLLSDEEKVRACRCVLNAKAHFVKTSTGFSTGGATIADVSLLKSVVQDHALVKASGGVRTRADLLAMLEAGASRIGTSNGVAIMLDEQASQAY